MKVQASFSHSAESSIYARHQFRFKMADIIMMKIQQDKMDLIFLIVGVFGSLNIQIESVGVFSVSCRCIAKKVWAKNIDAS